jgi:pimeloyl-ACP methyl ester carboxylesterase
MPFMADCVFEILNAENIEKCVMIGHSMGGYTTLAFAEKYPKMLNGFGLFHSHASADTEVAKHNRERTIEIIKQDKGQFINQFIPSLFAPENIEKYSAQIEIQITQANAMPKGSVIAAMAGMKERSSTVDILMDAKVPVLFIRTCVAFDYGYLPYNEDIHKAWLFYSLLKTATYGHIYISNVPLLHFQRIILKVCTC